MHLQVDYMFMCINVDLGVSPPLYYCIAIARDIYYLYTALVHWIIPPLRLRTYWGEMKQ